MEGHADSEGQNLDPREPLCPSRLPLHPRVLDVRTYLVSLLILYKIIFHVRIYSLITCLVRAYYVPDTVYSLGSSKSIKEANINQTIMQ